MRHPWRPSVHPDPVGPCPTLRRSTRRGPHAKSRPGVRMDYHSRSDVSSLSPARVRSTKARPAIRIGRIDQRAKRFDIELAARFHFHVSHPLAGAFEQAGRILERRTIEEPNVDMIL